MIDDIRTRALDPMIQSAVGIVRESAGLLYHIAGFGIALVSGPQNSRPNDSTARTRAVARQDANIIPFPNSKCRAPVQRSCVNGS